MNVLNIIILFALCCTSALCAPKWSSSSIQKAAVHQQLAQAKGRECKISICFAIDGSRSISESDFSLATDFTKDVISIISTAGRSNFGAVQYGMSAYPISPVSANASAVAIAIHGAKSKQDGKSSIAAGIAYCDSQLAKTQAAASRIVLIGDGRNNFGADPILAANKYTARDPNGGVIPVALGPNPHTGILQAIAAGNSVLQITEYLSLAFSVDRAVSDACH